MGNMLLFNGQKYISALFYDPFSQKVSALDECKFNAKCLLRVRETLQLKHSVVVTNYSLHTSWNDRRDGMFCCIAVENMAI